MILKYSLADVLVKCEQAEVPFSPIDRPEYLFDDAQFNQSRSLISTILPNGEQTKFPRLPFRLERQKSETEAHLSTIGEYTQDNIERVGIGIKDGLPVDSPSFIMQPIVTQI